jgi:transcriptional regulator with XRE-family HTH domain
MSLIPAIEPEPLGQRIARLRSRLGWTQSDLAERLAASRVAISHFEAGLAIPSERTIVILAGLFGLEPGDLVEGTSYPAAKAERLPLVACRYTAIDLQVALLASDLRWMGEPHTPQRAREQLLAHWHRELLALAEQTPDPRERAKIDRALQSLQQASRPRSA